jgi:hypothetical protein
VKTAASPAPVPTAKMVFASTINAFATKATEASHVL